MNSTLRRTWAEINLDALAHNYHVLRKQMGPNVSFMGVVKADAYGHGAIQVAHTLTELGADYFAVSSIDEACELRNGGITQPILQLGFTPTDQSAVILDNHITQALYSEAAAMAFSQAAMDQGKKMNVHIKLDTGMSRLGFQCDESHFTSSLESICRIASLPGLHIEGIFTHFAVANEATVASRNYTQLQHSRFEKMIQKLKERGITFSLCHCSNSGAIINYPQFAHDMCRPGVVTYGIGDEAHALDVQPVLTLKTVVGTIKEFSPHTTVSYGRTFSTDRPARLGVLPVGYADGLHRELSGKWKMWTPYGLAPIVGRICMDMCMVDLTDLPKITEGSEIEVFGPHNSINQAAHLANTIANELICSISKRVPRIYYKNGKEISRELMLRG